RVRRRRADGESSGRPAEALAHTFEAEPERRRGRGAGARLADGVGGAGSGNRETLLRLLLLLLVCRLHHGGRDVTERWRDVVVRVAGWVRRRRPVARTGRLLLGRGGDGRSERQRREQREADYCYSPFAAAPFEHAPS